MSQKPVFSRVKKNIFKFLLHSWLKWSVAQKCPKIEDLKRPSQNNFTESSVLVMLTHSQRLGEGNRVVQMGFKRGGGAFNNIHEHKSATTWFNFKSYSRVNGFFFQKLNLFQIFEGKSGCLVWLLLWVFYKCDYNLFSFRSAFLFKMAAVQYIHIFKIK